MYPSCLEHPEIRFAILSTLYQKHYSPQLGHPQGTDMIIQEAGLGNVERDDVVGDVVYLEDRGLIRAVSRPIGHPYPPYIIITSYGIDFVEAVINQSIETIESTAVSTQIKSDFREISRNNSPSSRVKKIMEYAKLNTDLWINITKIAGQFFSTGL